MVATSSPYGLKPFRRLGGGVFTGANNRYNIANGSATNIFWGDPVKRLATGYIDVYTTITDLILGVFQGCYWIDPVSKRPTWSAYFPAATSSAPGDPTMVSPQALVVDDPFVTFKVQMNASSSIGDTFALFPLVTTTAGDQGSTFTGISNLKLYTAGRGTASLPYQFLAFVDAPDNPATDANAFPDVEVRIAMHAYNTTAGI